MCMKCNVKCSVKSCKNNEKGRCQKEFVEIGNFDAYDDSSPFDKSEIITCISYESKFKYVLGYPTEEIQERVI